MNTFDEDGRQLLTDDYLDGLLKYGATAKFVDSLRVASVTTSAATVPAENDLDIRAGAAGAARHHRSWAREGGSDRLSDRGATVVAVQDDDPLPAVAPTAADPGRVRPRRYGWERRYTAATVGTDVLAVSIMVGVGHLLGVGTDVAGFGAVSPGGGVLAGGLMLAALLGVRAWDPRVIGQGSEEFSRVLRAVVTSAVALGLLGLSLEVPAARPWVFGLMPLGGVLAGGFRVVLRRRLHRLRRRGRCMVPVLAVGTVESVADLIDRTRCDTTRGWVVSGACTPTGAASDSADGLRGVPVLGDLDSVAEIAGAGQHRVVVVCPTPGWTPDRLRQLAWSVDDQATTELVVDSGLVEVAGPRLHVDPVDGLPLLRLTRPTFTGLPWIVKNIMDRLGSALLLVAISPVLLAIAVGIKLDGGPVLFRQTRVGRHGDAFTMLKFRSMVVDAEARSAELVAAEEGAGPLFAMKRDPRSTRFGAFLRRYSLDELPQLFNVLRGSMSLVGPRPPLPREVAGYGREAQRRLLVKPGVTGLWQVSGRSSATAEQSVQVDLRYVENWSLGLDFLVLWKTVTAKARSRGAF